jgi:TonB family protein
MLNIRLGRVLVVCFMATALWGQGLSEDQQLLSAAAESLDIRSEGSKPFQLDADFTALNKVPMRGHLTWKWLANDHWSQEITMPNFRQRNVRIGDTLYTSRNLPFTPLRVKELQDLFEIHTDTSPEWTITRNKRKGRGGNEIECIELRLVASPDRALWNPKREICIARGTRELLSQVEIKFGEQRTREFSDYRAFGRHYYPRILTLRVNESVLLKVDVVSLSEPTFAEHDFTPADGAIVRHQCDHMIPPRGLVTPNAAYPLTEAQSKNGGTAIVELTVLPDGTVDNPQLIESAGNDIDQAVLEVVRRWKFEPARCGNSPVAADFQTEFSFKPPPLP